MNGMSPMRIILSFSKSFLRLRNTDNENIVNRSLHLVSVTFRKKKEPQSKTGSGGVKSILNPLL